MTIAEVLNESVLAMFKDPIVSQALVLKGGSAMRLFGDDNHRLSIDVDFSLNKPMGNQDRFFETMRASLSRMFMRHGLMVIDFKAEQRPKKRKRGVPDSWGGWDCKFKLVKKEFENKSMEVQRRNAFIPEGANSPVIDVDISGGEYCGLQRSRTIGGVKIHGYTRELMVLEKIRAICQQHPSYKFTSHKNRSRDFYDIERLAQHADEAFIDSCKQHVGRVFKAKEVPLKLLNALWDDEFLSVQEKGFHEVVATVSGKIDSFGVYVEHVRRLIRTIAPDAIDAK